MMHMHHLDPVATDLPCACTALRKAARAVSRLYDSAVEGAGINIGQLAILRSLGRTGPQPLTALADTMVMDRTSLYRALGSMEHAGWVTVQATGRGRARIAGLTGHGRNVMDGAAASWDQVQTRFVDAFGTSDWAELSGALGRMVATASSISSTDPWPATDPQP